MEWNSIWTLYFLPFQFIDQSIFLYFKSPLWKMGVLLLKNNYIGIFIIKFLTYNQLQIPNLIIFIFCYKCQKKGHSTKMDNMIKKVNHLSVHSPYKITTHTHLVDYCTFFGYFFYHFDFILWRLGSPIGIFQFEPWNTQ